MNAFKHSFFISNQGADIYGHPISLFTIMLFCRALEDTSSRMGSPIYTHSLITCISLMHYVIVLPLSTLVPNHSLIGQCICDIFVHAFFQGFQSSSIVRGSHLHHASSFSWLIPYLGIDGIQQPFRSHACHQSIYYFRRDYYLNPFYLSCHMGTKSLYMLASNTFSDITSLVLLLGDF